MAEARFAPPKPNVSVFQGGSGQCLTLNNGRSMPAAGLGAWALRGRRAHGLRLQASSRRYGVLLRNRTGGRPGGARSRALGHPPRRHFCADETQSFAVRRSQASFEGRDDATRFGLCRHVDPSSSRSERSRRLPRDGMGGGARSCAPDRTLERVRRRAHDLSSGVPHASGARSKRNSSLPSGKGRRSCCSEGRDRRAESVSARRAGTDEGDPRASDDRGDREAPRQNARAGRASLAP